MLSFLRNSPFAVQAHFDSSIVLTFAAPQEQLKHLIPPCLELDMFEDEQGKKWAFIAVAMVQTKNLRPKGFPAFLGNDFFLIGFRVFVRYTNNAGKRLRGLYIIKSETDKKKMQLLGNFFTKYKYAHTDINLTKTKNATENTTNIKINSKKSGFFIEIERKNNDDLAGNLAGNLVDNPVDNSTIKLPENSPFKDWKQARRFAGPLPFTFSYNAENQNVTIVEGVREDWTPVPVSVLHHEVAFLKTLNIKDLILANAFVVENIPYFWKKGKIEQWKNEL